MTDEARAFCSRYKDDGTHLGMLARLALDSDAAVQLIMLGVVLERTVQGFYYPTNQGHQDPKIFATLQEMRKAGNGGPFENAGTALDAVTKAFRKAGLIE